MDAPLLEAVELRKVYGRREVVGGISLTVRAGEVVGLLGPNGAGKTTTFRMVMGMVRPTSGRVRLAGQEIASLPMYRRARLGVGYLAQEPSVFQRLTVGENLTAVLEFLEPDRAARAPRAAQVLERFGLTHLCDQSAARLSGGERRRLEIARALLVRPRIMLLDEPFSGVDPIAVGGLQDLVRQLRADGIGVLLTDHNVRETLRITDRAYIVRDGQIRTRGTPQEIVADPEARASYLGEGFQL